MNSFNVRRQIPLLLSMAIASHGNPGLAQMNETSDKRLVMLSIQLDRNARTVHLLHSSVAWLDPNKYPVHFGDVFELEYLLPGGRSLRSECSSLSVSELPSTGPVETPTVGQVNSALYTDEDGIGYRIWNKSTGEMLGEEMLPPPPTPPRVEISGSSSEGLRVKVDRQVTSIVGFCSVDQGQTWRPFPIMDITGKEPTPSRVLPTEASVRKGGILVEVRVMIGLTPYRERFQMDGSEAHLGSADWKRVRGVYPPIQQRTIVTATQDK
jgi:hypothetical protein